VPPAVEPLCRGYTRPQPCPALSALRRITAGNEQGDNRYSKEQLAEWRVHTTGVYEERWFEGNTDADYWGTSHRFLIDAPTKFQEFLAVRMPIQVGREGGGCATPRRIVCPSECCGRCCPYPRRTSRTTMMAPPRLRLQRRRVTRSPSTLV
jgi:hypothetical protein